MLSIPLIHHIYSSTGGYKTVYISQDPAAARIEKALVSVANTAYKGGMGATFRGTLKFLLPAPEIPRPTLGPWQLPPAVALGSGFWFMKCFPMGTDHVGRPRACVHSILALPERINPPPYWQPTALPEVEASLLDPYDYPADAIFLHGRDSLQGLRERTRDQFPWQPQQPLNRVAGLEWLISGTLPPALVGPMIKLLLYPGGRLLLLANEEHAMYLARMVECILPGSYRRCGGFLIGPQQRYLTPPLCNPNLILLGRSNEYTPGECLLDLTANPPRWVGPEPPTSPLASQVLDYLNRRDLTGLLRFIEMWDMLDEQPPSPARQLGGLAAMTSLKLIGPGALEGPWPNWMVNAAACAAALPFLIQAGWLTAHDAAWQQVKKAVAKRSDPAIDGEIVRWEKYVGMLKHSAADATPEAGTLPVLKAIVTALSAPSHSSIIAAVEDSMPDDSWMDDSSHVIPIAADEEAVKPASEAPEEFFTRSEQVPEELAVEPETELSGTAEVQPATGRETKSSGTFDVDAEFELPAIAPDAAGAPANEPETVQEDWEVQHPARGSQLPPKQPAKSASLGSDVRAPGTAGAKKSGTASALARKSAPRSPAQPKISPALEADAGHANPADSSLRDKIPLPAGATPGTKHGSTPAKQTPSSTAIPANLPPEKDDLEDEPTSSVVLLAAASDTDSTNSDDHDSEMVELEVDEDEDAEVELEKALPEVPTPPPGRRVSPPPTPPASSQKKPRSNPGDRKK